MPVAPLSTKDKLLYVWCPLGILLIFALMIRSILPLFIFSFAVAYIVNPLINHIHQRCPYLSKTLLSVLAMGIFYAVLVGFLLFFIPTIIEQGVALIQKIPDAVKFLSNRLSIEAPFGLDGENISWNDVIAFINEHTKNLVNASAKIIDTSIYLISTLSTVFLAPVITFYILVDWESMAENFKKLIPSYCKRDVKILLYRIDMVLSGYLRGELNVCLLFICYYAIAFLSIGLDYAFVLAFTNSFLLFLPYVGIVLSFVITLAVSIMQWGLQPMKIVILAVIFVVGQFCEGNFITPKLVGDKINIHPFWLIFSVFVGGNLGGLWGVLASLPVASILGVLIRFFLDKYHRKMNIQ